ncbi:aldehyde dehydrogenase family protein [Oceaniglobus ichthyenteri]|uniref:aldehyde dehydrogenase family protein n=1 Tax=Oceaniglobus ichthyenteri TaxID=2136177 RepID=UPI000D3B4A21|nr:aldehyde dehydrogenase family protein [Oceaniglobus ichthyenteri]
MTLPNPTKFYIDGAWVDATDREKINVTNPANGETIATLALATADDVNAAVAAARRALPGLRATDMAQRRAMLHRIRAAYAARIDDMGQAIMQELGAPIDLARAGQAAGVLGKIDAFIDACDEVVLSEPLANGDLVLRQPAGVAALITPWNWPLHQIMLKLGAALAAGCPMILKPSEVTPICATILAEVMHAADLPAGAFNMIHGDGAGAGATLTAHPGVDVISFTGSTAAGGRIARTAAEGIKRCALELGGKSACVIFADADLDAALTSTLRKAFNNSGQNCNAPTRLLIERSAYDDAVTVAARLAADWTIGWPDQPGAHIGPVANARQHAHIRAMIKSGLNTGARLVAGGLDVPPEFANGCFVAPTILADVTNDMEVARTEIFGPVVVMIPFDDETDALSIANDSDYGLAAFVHTADRDRAHRMIRDLEAGMVLVNGSDISPGSPFGGVKASGIGREGGIFGIEEFMEIKLVAGAP